MPETDFESTDRADDRKTDVVGTPEGDNEFAPDEPLARLPEDAYQTPRGSAPDGYRQEKGKA